MKNNLRDVSVSLVVVTLLIFTKIAIEKVPVGRWLNVRGYEILHSFLTTYDPNEELPVIVLDISDVKRDSNGVTPTASLQQIVEALVESGAKAIAIDIDFSPRSDPDPIAAGARSKEDEQFFYFLHQQERKGVPIFVGAYNIGSEAKTWLGTEKNKDLAADMTLFDSGADHTEVRASLRCGEDTRLYNISKALAEVSGAHPQPPQWLSPILLNYEASENLKETIKVDRNNSPIHCLRAYTLVNYAKLELIQKLTLQTLDRNAINGARNVNGNSKFQDKLVIIGNGQRDKATDGFVIIGRNEPVFGVYIHAVATYTLVADPVYRFKNWFSIFLDGFLGAAVVIGLFTVRRLRLNGRHVSSHSRETIFILISIFIILLLGFAMVRVYSILWLDFLLVVFSLLLHSKVQHALVYSMKSVFRAKKLIRRP